MNNFIYEIGGIHEIDRRVLADKTRHRFIVATCRNCHGMTRGGILKIFARRALTHGLLVQDFEDELGEMICVGGGNLYTETDHRRLIFGGDSGRYHAVPPEILEGFREILAQYFSDEHGMTFDEIAFEPKGTMNAYWYNNVSSAH